MLLMASGNELRWDRGIICVEVQGSMVLETGIVWGRRAQRCWVQGINEFVLAGVALDGFVSVIEIPMVIFRSLIL